MMVYIAIFLQKGDHSSEYLRTCMAIVRFLLVYLCAIQLSTFED